MNIVNSCAPSPFSLSLIPLGIPRVLDLGIWPGKRNFACLYKFNFDFLQVLFGRSFTLQYGMTQQVMVMIILKSNIRKLLKSNGIKGNWIVQQLNISQNQVINYVTVKFYPPVVKVFELAKVFNCRVDNLYKVQEKDPAN
ncbi:helix-turn-helix domain-containing protein [Bacillus thuringiensis]|uniref:helix-turn-helix domain-containing protein n=1 Tax=Bacillus thuringiensis TaxID=1428 RepID=UPI00211ED391|nr:helix-turn-helix transcriptional regulator [Bacillus thuringiensis]